MKNLISSISDSIMYASLPTDIVEMEMKNGFHQLPELIGNGKLSMMELEPGLKIVMMDASFITHYELSINIPEPESFIIAFKEMWLSEATLKCRNADEEKNVLKHRISSVALQSSLQNLECIGKKGSTERSLYIIVHPDWIEKQLHAEELTALIERLLQKQAAHVYNSIDVVFREMLNELFNCKDGQALRNQFIKNRVLLLLEKFFIRQHERLQQHWLVQTKSTEELQRLILVESVLIQSLQETAPTIDQLAKMAAMSATKLKSLFKDVYGMPVYVYYLHHRMQVAKKLLLTQEFSVREVGQQMGYQNISHFAAAFKKVHGILPGSLLGFK